MPLKAAEAKGRILLEWQNMLTYVYMSVSGHTEISTYTFNMACPK